jgi:hypothetical protein
MTQVDVNAFIGAYPFRDIGEWDTADLVREMIRNGSISAWVSHLSAVYWRDPGAGNAALLEAHQRDVRLQPILAVHPGMPSWQAHLDDAAAIRAPAVRADPTFWGIAPAGEAMRDMLRAVSARGLALQMAVRLEDLRQRHPHDNAGDLPPWAVRELIRAVPDARLVITHADRDFVEQVHFGLTPQEAARVLWDISWIWGPPEDHLELLLETVGLERFTFGTGMPLRLADTSLAKLDLLNLPAESRDAINAGNLATFLSR